MDLDATDVEVYGSKKRGVATTIRANPVVVRTWRVGRSARPRWTRTCPPGVRTRARARLAWCAVPGRAP